CVDSVCCSTACAGGLNDCQACSTALGAAVTGTCGPVSAGTLCRGSAPGGCDVPETCDGTSVACPPNVFAPATTVCRPAVAGGCDVSENCTGLAAACPADA